MKKEIKKIFIVGIFLIIGLHNFGQENFYIFNPVTLNPAYAGSKDVLCITAINRTQWIGIEGAPKVQTISMHSPIVQNPEYGLSSFIQNTGFGLSIVNDIIGSTNKTWVTGDYSYTININKKKDKLAFGLKLGADIFNVDFSDREVHDDSDIVYSTPIKNKIKPNFGFGMYYHSKKYYAGIAIPRLLSNEFNETDFGTISLLTRDIYLLGGYVFKLNSVIDLKPTILVKHRSDAPLSINLNSSILIHKRLWFGVMYRITESVGFNTILYINKYFNIGYAYDYSIQKIHSYNSGSHEIMVQFNFNKRNMNNYSRITKKEKPNGLKKF